VIVRKPWRSPTGVVLTKARPLIDERRKWPEDIAAKLEAIQGAYEATSDAQDRVYHLLGALDMCGPFRPLPNWLFTAVRGVLAARLPQEPDLHSARWLMVREGKQKREGSNKTPTWEDAYEYASERLAGTPWAGEPRTMKASYLIARHRLQHRVGQKKVAKPVSAKPIRSH
jgi:hypothetical protein